MAQSKQKRETPESFEELYAALEEKTKRLEQGNLPLEESLALYEDGAKTVDRLREILGQAELRVQTIQHRFEAERELREEPGEYDADPPEYDE